MTAYRSSCSNLAECDDLLFVSGLGVNCLAFPAADDVRMHPHASDAAEWPRVPSAFGIA